VTKNLGTPDRILRLGIGLSLSISALVFRSPVLAIFGIFTLYESLAGWCVIHQLIGRNTCPLPDSSPARKINYLVYYLSGLSILTAAIILNVIASYLGWSTWYEILKSYANLSQISLDNWIFLIVFYPLTLGIVVTPFIRSNTS
jgi:hypothetical protein